MRKKFDSSDLEYDNFVYLSKKKSLEENKVWWRKKLYKFGPLNSTEKVIFWRPFHSSHKDYTKITCWATWKNTAENKISQVK